MLARDGSDGTSSLASVTSQDSTTELRRFPLTDCARDDGWLIVEASGICGTDVALASGGLTSPVILGHHVVGRLADVGPAAASRWGVQTGDRIAVEEYLPCWDCPTCTSGRYRLCPSTDLWTGGRRVGLVPVADAPHLWGGNSEYMYLPANAVVHKLPPDLSLDLATWTQPVANAIDWVSRVGAVAPGDTVVILGPGYHGLAATAVAVDAGAAQVLVGGLPSDEARLALARHLGAATFDASGGDVLGEVRDLTGGGTADLVVDVSSGGPETLATAVSLLRPLGRLVVAGIKSPSLADVDTAMLVRGMLTVSGVRGRDPESVARSIDLLARGGAGLTKVPAHHVPLARVGEMLTRLASGRGPQTPHVVVRPWLRATDELPEGVDAA